MKKMLVLGLCLLSLVAKGEVSKISALNEKDVELAKQFAVSDMLLLQSSSKKDQELKKIKSFVSVFKINQSRHDCPGDLPPSGSASCWDACSEDGWSSSYCSNLCGTSSGQGSASCWDACSEDGWSSSYCSNLCGTSTGQGSAACWDSCTEDGWSSSYCATLCGTN